MEGGRAVVVGGRCPDARLKSQPKIKPQPGAALCPLFSASSINYKSGRAKLTISRELARNIHYITSLICSALHMSINSCEVFDDVLPLESVPSGGRFGGEAEGERRRWGGVCPGVTVSLRRSTRILFIVQDGCEVALLSFVSLHF